VFDPNARDEYLRGFSKRKEERRAYGLAMQKVKDRKARLEQRAELRQARREQVEEAERQKQSLIEENLMGRQGATGRLGFAGTSGGAEADDDAVASTRRRDESAFEKVETYQDDQTRAQWGGEVVVTTSSHIPGASDDEDDEGSDDGGGRRSKKKPRLAVDAEQEYAGNVEKYLKEIKTKLPSKKKKDGSKKHKGVHGASHMKGITGSGDIKIAKRALDRFQQKKASNQGNHKYTGSGSHPRRKR
jgi:ribosomal RNA-processing protein 17